MLSNSLLDVSSGSWLTHKSEIDQRNLPVIRLTGSWLNLSRDNRVFDMRSYAFRIDLGC
jgi:hypothetical protein